MTNPLQKYYRQPKIYLSLPSKGKYYPPNGVAGNPDSLPVFGMNAMDEIIMKTPDALFTGESIVSVIKSCIPEIVDPWKMPQLDIDAALVAIRMATYGQTLETKFKCQSCNEENIYDLDLSGILDYFSGLDYVDSIIAGPLVVNIRPLTYKELTELGLKTYEIRRRLTFNVSEDMSEEQKGKLLNDAFKKIGNITIETFKRSIVSIEADDNVVDNQQYIDEWLKNSDKDLFDKIKQHMESSKDQWSIQPQEVKCADCGAENKVNIRLDNSDFFVTK